MTDNPPITTQTDDPSQDHFGPSSGTSPHPIPQTLEEWTELAFSVHAYYAYLYGGKTQDDDESEDDDSPSLCDRYMDWVCENETHLCQGNSGEGLIIRGFEAALFLQCPKLPRVAPMMMKIFHERAFSITFAMGGPSVNSEAPSLFIVGLIAGHAALGLIPLHTAFDHIIDVWYFDRKTVCAAVKNGLHVDLIDPGDVENLRSFKEWECGLDKRPFRRGEDVMLRNIARQAKLT